MPCRAIKKGGDSGMDGAPRVSVVTGGSRGIGRGIVLALAELGHAVVVNYRSDAAAADAVCDAARTRGAPSAFPIRADVSDLAEGRRLVEESVSLAGRIELWVNNAGVAPDRRLDLLETTPESWDRVVGTNLRGPFFLSQSVAREMLRMQAEGIVAEPQIVFITSVSSRFASVNRGEYCVSKAGLSMVAHLFAARLAGTGIRVYEVRPGLIDTDMTRAVRAAYDARIAAGLVPMGRWGTAEDVGRAEALVANGGLRYSTGTVLDVDGGLGMRVL
jgi:3-oxoacyl-[acyl-carrier protein] reductase